MPPRFSPQDSGQVFSNRSYSGQNEILVHGDLQATQLATFELATLMSKRRYPHIVHDAEKARADRILLDRALSGDPHATDQLVKKLEPVVKRAVGGTLLAYGPVPWRVRLPDLVDEVGHLILTYLFKPGWPRLRAWNEGRASLSTWVRVITRSRTIDYIRKQKKRLQRETPWTPDELIRVLDADRPHSDDNEHLWQLLEAARAKVRQDIRRPETLQLFDLLYVEFRDVPYIQQVTGKTANAIHRQACRFRARLREAVNQPPEPSTRANQVLPPQERR